MTFTDTEREYLDSQFLGRLATVDAAGRPQNNPVGFVYNAETGTFDVGGHNLAGSRKFRNVAANGAVALVVDDLASVDPWRVRGIEIRGKAEALTDQEPPRPGMGREIIRIHPETIFSWGVDPDHPGMSRRTVG
jgi:pyridoxamine 5'-phosphate oxidase family protein